MSSFTNGEPSVGATVAIDDLNTSGRRGLVQRFAHSKVGMIGVVYLITLTVLALLAPVLPIADPQAVPSGQGLLQPGPGHWFGTDQLGRDELARIIFGARTSLLLSISATLAATVLAIIVGTVAGWYGRWLDTALMRLTEVVLTFPSILLAGVLVVALGRSSVTVMLVIALIGWPMLARVCRASVSEVRNAGFVEAAIVSGLSDWQIVRRHVLPHALAPVSVLAVLTLATSILAEAALSFLGVGADASRPSWGVMLYDGRRFMTSNPHLVVIPAVAVGLTVASAVFVSDGVRRALRVHD